MEVFYKVSFSGAGLVIIICSNERCFFVRCMQCRKRRRIAVAQNVCAILTLGAEAAAQLYHAGVVPYIIPSGGMKWDTDIGLMTEAERMNKYLKEFGVPEESILLENQATTTRENMIYATLLMEQKLKPRGNYRLYVVTSGSHLRRSMSLARLYLPRTAELIGVAGTCPTARSGQWSQDEFQAKRVYRELELIKKNIDIGDMADIEF